MRVYPISPPCSIDGCTQTSRKRGWCEKHYAAWKRKGDPLPDPNRAPYGSGHLAPDGYYMRYVNGVQKREHIILAEKALGKPLPAGALVHHVDENRRNNTPSNLVICPDRAYHALLHQRMRAYAACGHYDWRRCWICQQFDAPENLCLGNGHAVHKGCESARSR